MRTFILLIIFFLTFQFVAAQQNEKGSFKADAEQQLKDSVQFANLLFAAWEILFINPDSSVILAKSARDLAGRLHNPRFKAEALIAVGEASHTTGDFPQALEALFEAMRIGTAIGSKEITSNCLDFIGIAYVDLGDLRNGLEYLFRADKSNIDTLLAGRSLMKAFRMSNIGHGYQKLGRPDSALFFQERAKSLQDTASVPERSLILTRLGVVQSDLGNHSAAITNFRDAIKTGDLLNVGTAQYCLAELFHKLHQPDSSLLYAKLAYSSNQNSFQKQWLLLTSKLLGTLYEERRNIDSAFRYLQISMNLNNQIFGPEPFHRLQLLAISQQQEQQRTILRQKTLEDEKEKFENRIRFFFLSGALLAFLVIAILLYRNNRQKQKSNNLLNATLSNLKSTQAQLIQSEKMASLGELTAGIAHEIQNPLNFVNNFSEVNDELLKELSEERSKYVKDKASMAGDEVLSDIINNNEKIRLHGKRADNIVKDMLQHSRQTKDVRELTDVNELCDEFLRLSYHGSRAKDKTLHVFLKTDFDPSISPVMVVPQQIGRVLLNIYNNAFYAVSHKASLAQEIGYQPTVSVHTKKASDGISIVISDNGGGIAPNIADKIFQPFFTTKPAGKGTGLGLSLSYDIITKEHNGEIKVESSPGLGATFIIELNC